MVNIYPSLSVKGMIYIHSGAHIYLCHHKKPHKGDVVDQKTPYTLHAAQKYVCVWWCVMCSNPECTTLMGHQLHYKPDTVPDSKPGSIRTMSVSQLRGSGGSGGGSSHASAQTLFGLAWDTSISIPLYSVRITLKDGHWMKLIRQRRDGKSEHYWSLDIINIPPDSATCTI